MTATIRPEIFPNTSSLNKITRTAKKNITKQPFIKNGKLSSEIFLSKTQDESVKVIPKLAITEDVLEYVVSIFSIMDVRWNIRLVHTKIFIRLNQEKK